MFGFDSATETAPTDPVLKNASETLRHVDAGVVGLPDAAAGRAHVVGERLRGDAGDRRHASAAIGTDAAPPQRVVEAAASRLCQQWMCERHDGQRPEGKAESVHG